MTNRIQNDNISQAKKYISEADAILITAGAGMGVDSGLPDFRGTKGFWNAYPPIAKLGLSFSDMANPKWFDERPELAWAFYGHRLILYKDTVPHDGFKILLDLVKEKNDNYFIFIISFPLTISFFLRYSSLTIPTPISKHKYIWSNNITTIWT